MTGAERQARSRAKRYAELAALPKVLCECGCGTTITPINKKGRSARYAHGHNPSGRRFQPGDTESARKGRAGLVSAGKGSGSGHANWRGGEWRVGGGYVRRTLTDDEAAAMPTARRHGNGWSVPRSHYVWNLAHPDNPVQRGEVIHHVDRVRDHDTLDNFQKMCAEDHRALHLRSSQ